MFMDMAYKIMTQHGVSAFIIFVTLCSCFWILHLVIKMGDKHLTKNSIAVDKAYEQIIVTHENHRAERVKWYEQYEKLSDRVDRAMSYQKEEHVAIMSLLNSIENKIVDSQTQPNGVK